MKKQIVEKSEKLFNGKFKVTPKNVGIAIGAIVVAGAAAVLTYHITQNGGVGEAIDDVIEAGESIAEDVVETITE